MTITVEFLGGPADGKIMERPYLDYRYRIPIVRRISSFTEPDEIPVPDLLVHDYRPKTVEGYTSINDKGHYVYEYLGINDL